MDPIHKPTSLTDRFTPEELECPPEFGGDDTEYTSYLLDIDRFVPRQTEPKNTYY